MKLKDIAHRLECRLEGDGDVDIARVAGIEQAEAGDLTFFANPKYGAHLRATVRTGNVCIYTPDPRLPTRWEEPSAQDAGA